MLRLLPPVHDSRLLAGTSPADDAAIYQLSDDLALVQTVDFFTPIVDDPFTYGQIAAANSLSDVYAVGGQPLTALNIVAFPRDLLPVEVLGAILRGGAEKAGEAGVAIVGGHTVDDAEPKYGLAVTGTVNPHHFVTPGGARPGDHLLLTKPIGVGTITTALKAGAVDPAVLEGAVRWMITLNRAASRAMMQAGAHAATDITGFGLLGHLADLCRASSVAAEVSFSAVPQLPGARSCITAGFIPAGTGRNLEYLADLVRYAPDLPPGAAELLADPQTSGGLLVALAEEAIEPFHQALGPEAIGAEIGRVLPGVPGQVHVTA